MKIKKPFNFNNFQKFEFSIFKRASAKRTIYTQPLIDGEYKSLPARFVPPEIIRPNFASEITFIN